MKLAKVSDIEIENRENRAHKIIQCRAQGMTWIRAWKIANPYSKASDKSATVLALREFKWYRETHRDEIKEVFNAYGLDSTFAAEELLKAVVDSRIRVGATKRTESVKGEDGRISTTVTEEPILLPDANAKIRGLTLLAELREWKKDGNGSQVDMSIKMIINSQAWIQLQQVILSATKDSPEVRKRIADALRITE